MKSNGLYIGITFCENRTSCLVMEYICSGWLFPFLEVFSSLRILRSEILRKYANCLEVWNNCVNTHTHTHLSRAYSRNNFLKLKYLAKSFFLSHSVAGMICRIQPRTKNLRFVQCVQRTSPGIEILNTIEI